ncbi:Lysozyme 1 [Lucilia cuprina]|nr:Lysozyme 1 [Lucilia cuprina]
MKFFIALLAALALFTPAFGKTFTRCSLAREMYALGVPKSELPQWTCIAEHESSYRTNVVGPTNYNGSNDYEMYALGVPKSELPQWTCIAEHESSYRTNVVGPTNYNGSNDYGIFQINNYYWCQPANGRFSYNECKENVCLGVPNRNCLNMDLHSEHESSYAHNVVGAPTLMAPNDYVFSKLTNYYWCNCQWSVSSYKQNASELQHC